MAHLPYRCHGNFPRRQADQLPQLCCSGFCEMENESNRCHNGKPTGAPPSSEKPQAGKRVAALLKKIGIHPEAQRILGNSHIPVVSMKRLDLQSVTSSSLQPVVSLVRLLCQSQDELYNNGSISKHHQQNGFNQTEGSLEFKEAAPQSEPGELSDFSHPGSTPTSWTEPYCPENSPSEEPEQDSGFDCESNPDQPYILFDSGSDNCDQDEKTDSETIYLDPDPEETLVIELDPCPEPEQDQSLELEDEIRCKVHVVKTEDTEDPGPDLCCPLVDVDSSIHPSGPGSGPEEMESEDFCAVCLNGGDLLCCDHCPKVYHLSCHVPSLISLPVGGWVCSLCKTDQEPGETYNCENTLSWEAVKAPYTLSNQDQRRCEKLTLLLFCHILSAPFHEPVSPLARNYYQIIKRPIDLSLVRRKLDKNNTLHYFTVEQFVDDVLLMFKNCATFNYPDSEVAQAGRNLELFFLNKLKEIFPDLTFLSACKDRMDRAHLQSIHRKKRENYRKKRSTLSGKKYLL